MIWLSIVLAVVWLLGAYMYHAAFCAGSAIYGYDSYQASAILRWSVSMLWPFLVVWSMFD